MKSQCINTSGTPISPQQTTAGNETLRFNIKTVNRQSGMLEVRYFGANKEYIGHFKFIALNSSTYKVETSANFEHTFGGVTCSVAAVDNNEIDITFSNGVANSSVSVRYIYF